MEDKIIKVFKPRDKTLSCVHWIECYKCAEWVVEFREDDHSSFDYYCDEHLRKLKEKRKKAQ